MHDGLGRDDLVLAPLAVAQLDAFVAEDGNVAGAAARGLLELTLHAAAGEFESCAVAGAAGVRGQPERVRLLARLVGDVELDGRRDGRRLRARHQQPPDARGPAPGPPPRPPDLLRAT